MVPQNQLKLFKMALASQDTNTIVFNFIQAQSTPPASEFPPPSSAG